MTDTAYIWATSQYVAIGDNGLASGPIFTDPVLLGATDGAVEPGQGCGLKYDSANSRWKFGLQCDSNSADSAVDFDVAVHTYIMGFQYQPTTSGDNQLAAAVQYSTWGTEEQRLELALWTDQTSRAAINTAYTANRGANAVAYSIEFLYNDDAGGPLYVVSSQNK